MENSEHEYIDEEAIEYDHCLHYVTDWITVFV